MSGSKGGRDLGPLVELVPKLNPGWLPPTHLRPLANVIEDYEAKPFRVCFSVPPGHSKTETLLAFIVKVLAKHPDWTVLYVTYNSTLALEKSGRCQLLADRAGIRVVGRNLDHWRTAEGGGAIFAGFNTSITGRRADLIIVDDPFKNRVEAESAHFRQRIHDDFTASVYTRRRHGDVSVIVVQTRWHEDDLAGRLVKSGKYLEVRMPALSEDAEERPLWPELWTREALVDIRDTLSAYDWHSLYQGRPRPRGDRVFGDASVYAPDMAVTGPLSIGLDLAYTEGTASDYSVAVVGQRMGDSYYVREVLRRQLPPPAFLVELLALQRRHPTARWWFYGSGTELGAAGFIRAALPKQTQFVLVPAVSDKFVRAMPLSVAWNAGRVLVPGTQRLDGAMVDSPKWLSPYLSELASFTGLKDAHDDQVDASAGMYDCLARMAPRTGRSGGPAGSATRRM